MNKIVITGIGAVTPLANSFHGSWEAARHARTGIGPITRLDTSSIPWKMAGELSGFDPHLFLDPKEIKRTDPFVHYAVAAAVMAARDAGLMRISGGAAQGPSRYDLVNGSYADYLETGGVIIGSSRGGITSLEHSLMKSAAVSASLEGSSIPSRFSPYLMPATTVGMAASLSSQKLGIKGHCLGISNACSSGLNAIGEAFKLLKHGHMGPVFAGGSDAPICRLCLEAYGAARALSTTDDPSASRPFAATRDGFVIAEGSCILALETMDSALRRNAPIYAEIIGYANTVDSFHQTRPDMRGQARAIRQAVAEAGVTLGEIDHINAHGTSTILGDRVEAEAIKSVFEGRAAPIPVTALKSATGHMLAASGSLEAAFAAMSLREGTIPPTLNIPRQDSCCNIALVRELTQKKMRLALTTSFGFGGVNAALVLKRFN